MSEPTIKIDHPCPISWAHMQKSTESRAKLCESCSKKVYDFTSSSDEEIYLKMKQEPNLCGKFRADQLAIDPLSEKKAGYRFRFIILLFIGILGLHVKPLNAQSSLLNENDKTHRKETVQQHRINEKPSRISSIDKNKRTKGIVRHRLYRRNKRPIFSRRYWIGCPSKFWH